MVARIQLSEYLTIRQRSRKQIASAENRFSGLDIGASGAPHDKYNEATSCYSLMKCVDCLGNGLSSDKILHPFFPVVDAAYSIRDTPGCYSSLPKRPTLGLCKSAMTDCFRVARDPSGMCFSVKSVIA